MPSNDKQDSILKALNNTITLKKASELSVETIDSLLANSSPGELIVVPPAFLKAIRIQLINYPKFVGPLLNQILEINDIIENHIKEQEHE